MQIKNGGRSEQVGPPKNDGEVQQLKNSVLDGCANGAEETSKSHWSEATLTVSTNKLAEAPLDSSEFASHLEGDGREEENSWNQGSPALFIEERISAQTVGNTPEATAEIASRVSLVWKIGTDYIREQSPDSGAQLYEHLNRVAFGGSYFGGRFQTDKGIVEVKRDSTSTDAPIVVSLKNQIQISVSPVGISGIYVPGKSILLLDEVPELLELARAIILKCTQQSFSWPTFDHSKTLEKEPLT